ncbi:MAG: hypothetical protein O3C21_09735 [Verrucomicrobia bacterium]|nr:hypothetical protein [Verrucomicrobiota bacterium]
MKLRTVTIEEIEALAPTERTLERATELLDGNKFLHRASYRPTAPPSF